MAPCHAGMMLGLPLEGDNVNAIKILGVVLIVAGILGLVYGGFTYTEETHEAKIGPLVAKYPLNRKHHDETNGCGRLRL